MVGWSDLPADLSDSAALARLSGYLPAEAVVVSSDLSRARTTADAIAGARTRLPDEPDLRELNFGAWELRRFAEIEAEDAALVRDFYMNPGPVCVPGGESWNQLAARVGTATDRLLAAHAGGAVVAVAHFGTILTQIARALAIGPAEAFDQQIDNLSVTEILHDSSLGWRPGVVNLVP